jgi:hypothetical protein
MTARRTVLRLAVALVPALAVVAVQLYGTEQIAVLLEPYRSFSMGAHRAFSMDGS